MEKLSEAVGFEVMELKDLPFKVKDTSYVNMENGLAEITYTGEEQTLTYRKSKGIEDNSGDYTIYGEEKTIQVGNQSVTIKGDNHSYSLAVWTDGEFSYSLSSQEGMTEEKWLPLIVQLAK